MKIKISTSPQLAHEEAIKQMLSNYNLSHTAAIKDCINESLEIILEENNQIIGGLLGRSLWGTLEIQSLVIAEDYRKKGLGRDLMLKAEKIARQRGCHYISLNTFSFQASGFYQNLGYKIFAEEKDFPLGYSKLYLRKTL